MSEPFVGEIRMFAGTFAPQGWAICDGQLLAVAQNDALFSLITTTYGGDGRVTFGLPDMRGRVPIKAGSGPGLSPRNQGAAGGAENVTIVENELPSHNHNLGGNNATGDSAMPAGYFARDAATSNIYSTQLTGTTADLSPAMITPAGGSRAHTNMMPFICINFIIALFGVYPSRN